MTFRVHFVDVKQNMIRRSQKGKTKPLVFVILSQAETVAFFSCFCFDMKKLHSDLQGLAEVVRAGRSFYDFREVI